ELIGAFDSFVELLHACLDDARADGPAASSILRVLHMLLMLREVTHVLMYHTPWVIHALLLGWHAGALRMFGQDLDHLLHPSVPQQLLQLFGQWQTLWRVGTRGRLGTVIQMLLRVSPVDDANIRMELTLQQWIDPVATIRQGDHLLCLTKSPTLGLQAAHRVELTGVPHRRRVRREQS